MFRTSSARWRLEPELNAPLTKAELRLGHDRPECGGLFAVSPDLNEGFVLPARSCVCARTDVCVCVCFMALPLRNQNKSLFRNQIYFRVPKHRPNTLCLVCLLLRQLVIPPHTHTHTPPDSSSSPRWSSGRPLLYSRPLQSSAACLDL